MTPQKAETRELAGGAGFGEQTERKATNSKRLANLRARLALCGFELIALQGGGYLIARWNLNTCTPADVDTVGRMAARLGMQA